VSLAFDKSLRHRQTALEIVVTGRPGPARQRFERPDLLPGEQALSVCRSSLGHPETEREVPLAMVLGDSCVAFPSCKQTQEIEVQREAWRPRTGRSRAWSTLPRRRKAACA